MSLVPAQEQLPSAPCPPLALFGVRPSSNEAAEWIGISKLIQPPLSSSLLGVFSTGSADLCSSPVAVRPAGSSRNRGVRAGQLLQPPQIWYYRKRNPWGVMSQPAENSPKSTLAPPLSAACLALFFCWHEHPTGQASMWTPELIPPPTRMVIPLRSQ